MIITYTWSWFFRVTECRSKNMMTSENLAIVFGPTLMRSPDSDPMLNLMSVGAEQKSVELLISQARDLFLKWCPLSVGWTGWTYYRDIVLDKHARLVLYPLMEIEGFDVTRMTHETDVQTFFPATGKFQREIFLLPMYIGK